jgi:hypothetical protein
MGLQLIEEKLSLLEKVAIFRYKRSEKKKICRVVGRAHILGYW